MKKITFILTALFAVSGTYANQANNELDYASTKDIRDINPHLYSGEMAAQNMVFEPLVINSEEGIKPWLAESWTISPDGRTYTFRLRQNVTFSDGEPFNAQAVKANFDAVLKNSKRHAWLELVREIEKTEVIDEHTFRLQLKHAYYPTLTELGLTRPFRFISPKAFIENSTANGVTNYAGTGPWLLAEHKKNQFARFTVNPTYWGKKPALNAVVWNIIPDRQTLLLALQKGDIQLIFGADGDMLNMDAFEKLSSMKQFDTKLSDPVASRSIVLNSNRPITQNLQVRQALEHSVNKAAIAKGIFDNSETVAQTLMAKNVPYADVQVVTYDYDLNKARQLLEDAGWSQQNGKGIRQKDGKPLSLVLSYNINNAAEKDIAELMQSELKQIGIDLQVLGEEKQAFLDRQQAGDFDLQYSLSWGKPYDPASFVSSFRIPAHADYQGQKGLKNKAEIDRTISELLITSDETLRRKLYAELWQTLAEQAVYIPLTYSRTKAIYNKALSGVGFNQSQYEIPFEKMYFNQP